MHVLASLLGDARLPTGGHTQSAGLEAALIAGMPVDDVPAYISQRLRSAGLVDAGTAVVARHHAIRGLPLDVVTAEWAARTPSHVARQAAHATGRGYLLLLQRFWPDAPATVAVAQCDPAVRPVVLGAIAAAAGLDAPSLVRAMSYDEAQTIASAALKLEPLDPLDATSWLLAVQPDIDDVTTAVVHLTDPVDIPAPAAPLMDQWSLDHARLTRRLFSA